MGKAFYGGCVVGLFVVFVQYPLQVQVGGAAGLDVTEVFVQGAEYFFWEDGFGQKRLQQGGETFLPFLSVRLHTPRAILLIYIVMRYLMHVCDEHLVGVQIEIECDGADAVLGSGWTEIA